MKKKNHSVLQEDRSGGKDPDRKNENLLIVINGYAEIASLDRKHAFDLSRWRDECASVHASFKKKTSRKGKYEYTNWYKINSDGGLESIGKNEPDYKQYYPPEPEIPYSFKVRHYKDHLVIDEKDYHANLKLFCDYLAFRIADCKNFIHPLYTNPDMFLSVRQPAEISSSRKDRTKLSCMRCGRSFSGSISDHECERKVTPGEALAFISGEDDPEFPDGEDDE